MTLQPHPETGPMLFADCPFCDAPAIVDEGTGTLDCEACAARFAFADEPVIVELALAA
jgi:hypothetical protein